MQKRSIIDIDLLNVHIHINATFIYIQHTFPAAIYSVSRETSSLSWYTSHKWIFNLVPPRGCLRKGFNWFKANNYKPYFSSKSVFIHGCLHFGVVVLWCLGCFSLPLAGLREGDAVCLSLHFRPEGVWCLPLCVRLQRTSIGCVAMQEVEPGSQSSHTAHLFISSCIQYCINSSSSGKGRTLFNQPLLRQNLFHLFLLRSFLPYPSKKKILSFSWLCSHPSSYTLFLSVCGFNQAWKQLEYTILSQILQMNPNGASRLIMYWADFICLCNYAR